MTYTLTLPDQSEQEVKDLQEGLFAAVDILLKEVSDDMRSQLNGLNPLDPLLKKCHYYDDQGEFFLTSSRSFCLGIPVYLTVNALSSRLRPKDKSKATA